MKPLIRLVLALAAACLSAPAFAQESPTDWPALTRTDLEAAASLIRDNHPAMVPEVGDAAFTARFAASLTKAQARVPQVRDADGMAATLRGFASGLGDDHIAWAPKSGLPVKSWPGFMVVKRGVDLVVTVTEPGGPTEGARLVACDGTPAATLLRERTADRVPDPDIAAQLTVNSIWVVLDDGNPFIARPRQCRFEAEGQPLDVALNWRPVTAEDFPRIRAGRRLTGHAGYGVRAVGEARWIAFESFDDSVAPVVEAVRARQAELRAAPMVVIDLRGNGGGNSRFGDQVASILLGDEPMKAISSSGGGDCPTVWRASPDNRKSLAAYAARMPDSADYWNAEGAEMDAALAAGRPLTASLDGCTVATERTQLPPPPHPLFPGKLVVLTDAACFSSCTLVVDHLLRLGAIQVGAATNAPTRYMEVRSVDLPSGLGGFSTLQKAALSAPPLFGPFDPAVPFPGDITNTAALEAWVPGAVAGL